MSEEAWAEIPDFTGYYVSNYGRVLSSKTDHVLTPTKKPVGFYMVGLMKNGIQAKRSLPLLVMQAFWRAHPNARCDTPIHLDGDRANCRADNLRWRPLWFSRKYMAQFGEGYFRYSGAVQDMDTGDIYEDAMHASTHNGVLENEVRMSVHNGYLVFPTNQRFCAV